MKQKNLLANNSVGAVSRCGCGNVGVHVGALSFRMRASELVTLAELLVNAVAELDGFSGVTQTRDDTDHSGSMTH